MTAGSFLHPRDEIEQTMRRIYRYRMTTTSGGNLSIRDEGGAVWITPARLDKGALRRDDVVRIGPDGSRSGGVEPSSELPLHQAVYRERPELRAIVHAHPVALVAFSIVHQVPDPRLFHQAWNICGEGGFAPYRLPGSAALGESVAGAFAAGHDCVILENHGVVVGGADMAEAFRRFETFEFVGKTAIKARLLAPEIRYLTHDDFAAARGRVGVPLGPARSTSPSSRELELRVLLRDFVRRGYRQRLFISTHGTFSARLDERSFLITPHHADRGALETEDLVLVTDGRAEEGQPPSHGSRLHAAIYARHPDVGAIVNAAPVNATAFSVTDEVFDTRTIPESRVVLRSPGRVPFRLQFDDPAALAALLTPERQILVLENDGALVVGTDILQAFDRLEVLESTAEAVINARALGELAPMGDAAIEELEAFFFGT
jgi:L-fuculose-phosphate aldolase